MNVTNENFGELLLQGLREAIAIERGEAEPARRVHRHRVTERTSEVVPPPRYSAADVRRIRERLGVSQPIFGRMLNASDRTVKAWEQGARTPDGPSLRLLEIAERHPEALVEAVREKTRPENRYGPGETDE